MQLSGDQRNGKGEVDNVAIWSGQEGRGDKPHFSRSERSRGKQKGGKGGEGQQEGYIRGKTKDGRGEEGRMRELYVAEVVGSPKSGT